MPLPFTSSIPRFRVTFNLATGANTMSIYDLINTGYSSYGTTTNFKGILKVVDPDNVVVYQNSGWSLTAPNFSSPDINGLTPTWTKSAITLPATVKLGVYTFTYIASIDPTGDPTRSTFVTVTKTYDYEVVLPTVSITYDLSCRTSELTSTDSTDYDITIGATTYTPTITRTHTLIKPAGAGCNSPAAVTTVNLTWGGGGTALTDLWTNTWQTTISSVTSFNLDTWTGDTWVVVAATITGSDHFDVQCSDLICAVRQCLYNLITDWKATIGVNFKREAELRTKILKALTSWTNYELAERCGEDTSVFCEEIEAIVVSENCTCQVDTDASSVRVVAWGNGTGQAAASTFAFTVSASNPTGGNTGDMHYNTATYHIWRKDSAWVDYGSIQGATGAAGAAGSNQSILDHDVADHATTATTARETLYSVTMAGGFLATAGDVLEMELTFQLAANANGKTLYLKFGGTDEITYFTDTLVNTSNNVIILKVWITRTGSATQDIKTIAYRNGYPPSHIAFAARTENLAADIVLYADAQNTTASASDITLKEFKAVNYKMIP